MRISSGHVNSDHTLFIWTKHVIEKKNSCKHIAAHERSEERGDSERTRTALRRVQSRSCTGSVRRQRSVLVLTETR